jgi:hypothetical protein
MMFDPATIAHVVGVPVEELAPFAGGTGLLIARGMWIRLRARIKR